MPPETRYAQKGETSIAYQVVGDGPLDLVFIPGFVSHLDLYWAAPETAAFLRRLASYSRLILFDKRGTGLSDPVSGAATLEERMEDVHAVLDACGSQQAALFGGELVGINIIFLVDGLQAAGEVGGFESAGVVFVFRLAALVRGFRMGRARGLFQNAQTVRQGGDDLFYQPRFVHLD